MGTGQSMPSAGSVGFSDWPGMPGVARNARALAALGWDEGTLCDVWAGNAMRVYRGLENLLAPDEHRPEAP